MADYLALPKGKGGYHTVLLILDTFSQYVWGFKLKTHGTARTTVAGLQTVKHSFWVPETFMTDGGSHFNNGEVRAWCEANGTRHQVVAAYAPWVNGLVENANGKLLGWLKHLCSPGLGEDEYREAKSEEITRAWSDHFDSAVEHLNERVIPAFQFTPKELLFGLIVNTSQTPTGVAAQELSAQDVNVHFAYAEQQRLDAGDRAVMHTIKWKATFDRRVLLSKEGVVTFNEGQLVQVHDATAENTFATSKKLLPRWSVPRRVVGHTGNSYKLATLEGFPVGGAVHARRLRRFIPCDGTALAEVEEDRQHEDEQDQDTEKANGGGNGTGVDDSEQGELEVEEEEQ